MATTSTERPSPARRIALALMGGALLLVGGTGAVGATETDTDLEASDCYVADGSLEGAGCGQHTIVIEPDPTVTSPTPHAWDRVVVGADGVTLDVYFWMGVRECNGLHSVDVAPTDTGIDLVLMTGIPAGAEDMVCIALAQDYRTTVVLEEPLVTGVE